jgi:hypothetical protein
MSYLIGFPLLIIPFAIYNMIAFLMGLNWTDPVWTIPLVSDTKWVVTTEDILLTASILLLSVEIMKSTRMGIRTMIDHVLSMILFIIMLIEFLLVKQAGTSTFFILMVISFVDVITGFVVTTRTAQRDIEIERVGTT